MTRNVARFVVILVLVCSLMGGGVAVLYGFFTGRIAERDRTATRDAIAAVVPAGSQVDAEKPLAGDPRDGTAVYVARDASGRAVAYVASGAEVGYSSLVRVMVGVTGEADALVIHKVVVVSQAETPGLGAHVAESQSTYTLWQKLFGAAEPEQFVSPFLDGFPGKRADEVQGIQAITAATITSDATKAAVDQAVGRVRRALKDRHEQPAP